jgi:hypothetical protein
VDRYFPTPATPQEPAVATAREHARLAAGEYVWSRQQRGDYQEALFLVARFLGLRTVIRANADGTIETPATMTFQKDGRKQTWREVGPFVWRDVAGEARLVMKVRDGQVESVWSDQAPSFWVNVRVPTIWSAGLNVPLLLLSTGVLLLAVVSWPVVALARRRTGRRLEFSGRERRAHQWTRVAAVLGVLYVVGWAVAMIADFASIAGAEPRLRAIQLIGLLCGVGAAVAVWNVWLTWRSNRGIWARVWSLVLAAALLYLVWFSFAFHLISVDLG